MNLVTVTLGELVDRALERVQAPPEIGRSAVVASDVGVDDGSIQVIDATVIRATDILELGTEVMFVSAKSDNTASANLSVVRGHDKTTRVAHTAREVGVLNPRWTRARTAKVIRESFTFMEANGMPLILTDPFVVPYVDPFDNYTTLLPVPEFAKKVYRVMLGTYDVAGWVPVSDLPEGSYPDSKVVRLPRHVRRVDLAYSLVYSSPYRWSTYPDLPGEDATIDLPEGTELLPPLYASWQMVSDREVSRSQIDRSEEAVNGQRDTGPTLVRLKQQEFYGALDAARRLQPRPWKRDFQSNPTWTGMRRAPI